MRIAACLLCLLACNPAAKAGDPGDSAADAKALLGPTLELKKQLTALAAQLDNPKLEPNAALDKALTEVALHLDLKPAMYALKNLPPETVAMQVELYAGVAQIHGMLDTHVKSAKADTSGFVAARNAPDAPRYGVVLVAEKAEFGAQIVELGPPLCNGKPSKTGTCADGDDTAATFRKSPTTPVWTKADLATPSEDSIAVNKLVPILPTDIFQGLLKGNETSLGTLLYLRRLRDIRQRTTTLLDHANKVEIELQRLAAR
jgi:hypothetical protein